MHFSFLPENVPIVQSECSALGSVANVSDSVSPIVFTVRVGILALDAILVTTSSIMPAHLSVHWAPMVL